MALKYAEYMLPVPPMNTDSMEQYDSVAMELLQT